MSDKRTDFRHLERLRVRWAEVDLQKIVFNGERLSAAARRWSSAPPVPRQISVDGPNRRSCDGMLACGAVGQCKFQTPLAWPMRGVGTAKRLAARGLTGA